MKIVPVAFKSQCGGTHSIWCILAVLYLHW